MTFFRRFARFTSFIFAAALASSCNFLHADDATSSDDTFISLERRPTPLSDTPANVTVITEQQIKDSGAKSLDEILDKVVSVDVQRTGSVGTFSTVRMRGVPSSAQVKILVDDQSYGGFQADQNIDISQIPLDNVEKIEIVRGGSSVLYGANTTGGVIHIFTKKKPDGKVEANVGYEARSYDTHIYRGDAGVDTGRAYARASYDHLETDGFQSNSDANMDHGALAAGYVFPNAARVGVEFTHLDNQVGSSNGTLVPISDWDGHKERVAVEPTATTWNYRSEGRVHADVPLFNVWHSQTQFYGSDDSYRYDNDSVFGSDGRYNQTTHILGAETRLLNESGFTAGLTYERDEFSSLSSFSSQKLASTLAGGYAQQEFKNQRFSFIPALRYDYNKNFGGVLNPRLTGIYRAAPSWTVSSNIARSYRAPSFNDQTYQNPNPPAFFSNPNIRPETAWTYDLGNEWKPAKNHSVKVVAFYTKMQDRIVGIDTNGDSLPDTNGNEARAELNGVEFENRSVWGPVTQWSNYTYQRSRGNDPAKLNSTVHTDIPLTPQHMLNIGLDAKTPGEFLVSNVVQYVGSQYELLARTGIKLASYALWNARVSKKIKGFEIFAAANNILDRHYAEGFGFDSSTFQTTLNPMPGRNYAAGVSYKFLQE